MNCLFYYAFVLGVLPFLVNAQKPVFFWKFDASLSSQVPTCQALKIVLVNSGVNGTGLGTPPYFMNAFASGGAVDIQNIGTDPANLQWTPRHPVGSKLLLNVIDANGSSGGVPANLIAVANGQSTACIPGTLAQPAKDFVISANVTNSLQTCAPWGIRISGGVQPYKISLLATNSPVTTNVTMAAGNDAFVYANRADPNTQLLAAVSDFTGRYAFGTPVVPTTGSSDTTCPASNSIATTVQVLNQDAAIAKKAANKRTTALVAGIVVPILVLLIGGSLAFFFWRRKRLANGGGKFGGHSVKRLGSTDTLQQQQQATPGSMESGQMEARQDGQVLSIASYLNGPPPARTHTLAGSVHTTSTMMFSPTGIQPVASPTFSVPSTAYTTRSSSLNSGARPGFAGFPRQSVRHPGRGSAKAIEAGYSLDDEEGGAGPSAFRTTNPDSPMGSSRQLPVPGGQEIVYQHQDSAVTVRELPPPYMYQGAS